VQRFIGEVARRRNQEMASMKRRLGYYAGSAAVALTALCMVFIFAPNVLGQAAQGEQILGPTARGFANPKKLPPGGPTARTADGHPDLSGRYYPGSAGRMVALYTPSDNPEEVAALKRHYDPEVTPQEQPVFRPETESTYQYPTPYGICAPGGTPTSITTQATENGPFEIVQVPGAVWILTEFPQTIRWVPTDGRAHSEYPDVSFNGESVGHWEGDTLVVDTIAIDTRMRNISVGRTGDRNAWTHSEEERVIERFSRPSKNYLYYQVTVIDPVVLEKPFTSVPHVWSLAQRADDNWTEYLCTANEEPEFWENVDAEHRETYERGGLPGPGGQ
jgi:hypothetical protein